MVTKIGAAEFKRRVIVALKSSNPDIQEEDLYFSQMLSGYFLDYRPKYPDITPADFLVSMDLDGHISIHGNTGALIPTIERHEDLDNFEVQMGVSCVSSVNIPKNMPKNIRSLIALSPRGASWRIDGFYYASSANIPEIVRDRHVKAFSAGKGDIIVETENNRF